MEARPRKSQQMLLPLAADHQDQTHPTDRGLGGENLVSA